jgi:hypothetical protein
MIDAAVTITLKASDYAFHFQNLLGNELEIGNRLSIDKKLFERPMLRSNLEKIVKEAGPSLELDFSKADQLLRQMHLDGLSILLNVVGPEHAKIAQIEELFVSAFEVASAGGKRPVVRIVAPADDIFANTFPFEILPFLRTRKLPTIDNYTSLAEAVGAFLGFTAIVDRASFHKPPDLELAAAKDELPQKLPIKLFLHAKLPGARDEAIFLQRLRELAVDGPWPLADVADGREFVAARIADPSLLLDGGEPRAPVDQIQHFSCHCETQTGTANHYFSLQGEQGAAVHINLSDLPALAYLYRRETACDMPLVLFNNCGGAGVDPRQIGSFVEFFAINNGNRGFIGTQAKIPDRLGEAFSRQFYANLLRKHQPVGLAVTEARQALALAYRNPLSLLYVHYGSPWLGVRAADPPDDEPEPPRPC